MAFLLMDSKWGLGWQAGRDGVEPACGPDDRREPHRSREPAFNRPDPDDAGTGFAIWTVRFHFYSGLLAINL
jgi:hypothetical protein